MSAETKKALDEALEAHLRDECDGAMVTGYTMHASYLNPALDGTDSTGYFAIYHDGQPRHVAIGLVQMQLHYLLSPVYEVIYEIGDDDDD